MPMTQSGLCPSRVTEEGVECLHERLTVWGGVSGGLGKGKRPG